MWGKLTSNLTPFGPAGGVGGSARRIFANPKKFVKRVAHLYAKWGSSAPHRQSSTRCSFNAKNTFVYCAGMYRKLKLERTITRKRFANILFKSGYIISHIQWDLYTCVQHPIVKLLRTLLVSYLLPNGPKFTRYVTDYEFWHRKKNKDP